MEKDLKYLKIAYQEALKAYEKGEVPVGAVLVDNLTHKMLAKSYNQKESKNDISSHAEINVIRKASRKLNNRRLDNTTLYVTLEPCSMCMSAIIQARIARVVYIVDEPNMGSCFSKIDLVKIFNSKTTISKVEDKFKYGELLNSFFKNKRKNNDKE